MKTVVSLRIGVLILLLIGVITAYAVICKSRKKEDIMSDFVRIRRQISSDYGRTMKFNGHLRSWE